LAASDDLRHWIATGDVRSLNGRRIFTRVAETANRPPLLLIHGYPTSSHDWHAVWDALAERHSLYTLDLLGFGGSEKPRRAPYTIAEQADLCQALLAQHGVGRVHVLAHDYGDTVAQELLARAREGKIALDSVMFLNGGLFPETHRARPIQKLLAKPLLGPLLASTSSRRCRRSGAGPRLSSRICATCGGRSITTAAASRWRVSSTTCRNVAVIASAGSARW